MGCTWGAHAMHMHCSLASKQDESRGCTYGLAQHDSPEVEALQCYVQPGFLAGLAYGQRAYGRSTKKPSCPPEDASEHPPSE